jgi:hypothetical protein
MNDIIKIVLALVLIVVLVAIGPLLTIWALNTLFPALAIAYDFWTWLAVVILGAALRANVSVKRKN